MGEHELHSELDAVCVQQSANFFFTFDETPRNHLISVMRHPQPEIDCVSRLCASQRAELLRLYIDIMHNAELALPSGVLSFHFGNWRTTGNMHGHLLTELEAYLRIYRSSPNWSEEYQQAAQRFCTETLFGIGRKYHGWDLADIRSGALPQLEPFVLPAGVELVPHGAHPQLGVVLTACQTSLDDRAALLERLLDAMLAFHDAHAAHFRPSAAGSRAAHGMQACVDLSALLHQPAATTEPAADADLRAFGRGNTSGVIAWIQLSAPFYYALLRTGVVAGASPEAWLAAFETLQETFFVPT
eukprot:TRINITY_DN9217_c0_g1_i2.p1 TRINITY_DN9217_c0_g1~~TRINITY_DN9217_c0_g1_i2.p1  ORF type:complete len:300 (-),score=89.66 TRINITY_DN9217_c0_g1_i2:31-930(-)